MDQKIKQYKENITHLRKEITRRSKRNKIISLFRFLSLVSGIITFYVVLPLSMNIAFGILSIALIIFIVLVVAYTRDERKIRVCAQLASICENEIGNIKKRTNTLFDHGEEYTDPNHAYSSDLDIFGDQSLFQYINRCVTRMGRNTLAQWLSAPAKETEISKRQDTVKELSPKTQWRQDIMRYGLSQKLQKDDPKEVIEWANTPSTLTKKSSLYGVIIILPIITISALIYSFFGSYVPLSLMITIQIAIILFNNKRVNLAHVQTAKRGDMLKTYAYILQEFENKQWQSDKLASLQDKLSSGNIKASEKINQLTKLINLMDQRLNIVVQLTINLLFFYELHLLFAIEKWRKNHGAETESWFQAIGEIEALSSLGNLQFNHQEWSFPQISSKHLTLEAQEIGHPLIDPQKRVNNDYILNGKGIVHIITGSNMAGKSTFLRTIGINVVLALSGAPVCAQKMKVSTAKVNTSMRIKDSIQDNESSFYAELKRIQQVLGEVNKKENTLLLLDEILRGTNSKDKQTGSKALIKQLVKHDAVAMVATHDLELSYLADELPGKVENRFFDIKIEGDQLFFDYKLNHGVCKTFNAPILMRKMGIDMDILNQSH